MLRNLHVKNLALIREADVDFAEGLNILTGETGAGKSILIESIGMALGGKIRRDLVRQDGGDALSELVFEVREPGTLQALREMDAEAEDGVVLISRRIRDGRSISRINGTTVTAAEVRKLASLLIDIHGQSEHQKLLESGRQLQLIDAYGGAETAGWKEETAARYESWNGIRKQLEKDAMSPAERARTMSFLEYEIAEITEADPQEGEDAELEASYRRMSNARRIMEGVSSVYRATGYEDRGSAGEAVGHALKTLEGAADYDPELSDLVESLSAIDDMLNDFNRGLSEYMESLTFEEEEFRTCEDRLNLLNHLKSRYGDSIPEVLAYRREREEELSALRSFEEDRERLLREEEAAKAELLRTAEGLSQARRKAAEAFSREVARELADLNFARADFSVSFERTEHCGADGFDRVHFRISTNPGEPARDLDRVVSGGELSRIMLAVKTVFAEDGAAGTMIFDEIDAGISGRTAQKVAEKMARIGREHQILCITHLPQIAAMADTHYRIRKDVTDDSAITNIEPLDQEESVEELARLLGGAEITGNTLNSASEMKEMCRQFKKDAL